MIKKLITKLIKKLTLGRLVVLWTSENAFKIVNLSKVTFISAQGLVGPGEEWAVFINCEGGDFQTFTATREQVEALLENLPQLGEVSRTVTEIRLQPQGVIEQNLDPSIQWN